MPAVGEPESPRAFPDDLAAPLLFFSAAKSDLQAVRLVSALSGASATALQAHGDGQSLPWGLAHALAGLMSMPLTEPSEAPLIVT